MADHEAIIYLENIGELLEYVTHKDYLPYYREALTVAKDALEKQIPKTPMYKMVYGKRLTDEAGCIECANTVYRTEDFCPYCGQAIDWSEVE